MSNEQAVPETKGVTVTLLATIDLGLEIEGMAGRQLRMRKVTIEPGAFSGRFTTIQTGLAPSISFTALLLTIEMVSPRSMARVWAGLKTGTPRTGLKTGE